MVSPPRGYTKILLLSYNAEPMDEISTFAFMNYVIIELFTISTKDPTMVFILDGCSCQVAHV